MRTYIRFSENIFAEYCWVRPNSVEVPLQLVTNVGQWTCITSKHLCSYLFFFFFLNSCYSIQSHTHIITRSTPAARNNLANNIIYWQIFVERGHAIVNQTTLEGIASDQNFLDWNRKAAFLLLPHTFTRSPDKQHPNTLFQSRVAGNLVACASRGKKYIEFTFLSSRCVFSFVICKYGTNRQKGVCNRSVAN